MGQCGARGYMCHGAGHFQDQFPTDFPYMLPVHIRSLQSVPQFKKMLKQWIKEQVQFLYCIYCNTTPWLLGGFCCDKSTFTYLQKTINSFIHSFIQESQEDHLTLSNESRT